MTGQRLCAEGVEFEILKQIGKGKGGYSYLAQSPDGAVVLKKMHYEPNDTYTFEANKLESELRDYKRLNDVGIPLPKLLYVNREEQFLVKEYIDGQTLSEIVGTYRLGDSHIRQIFEMCALLYPAGLNIDYFPPNFVEQNGKLYYIDYECNGYMEEWDFEHWGIYFLANSDGMAKFLETGDHSYLSKNAKPHREGFEEVVARFLALK